MKIDLENILSGHDNVLLLNKVSDSELKLRELDSERQSTLNFSHDGTWFVKITKKGFEFNKQEFPDMEPDDFAKKFLEILEECGYIYKPPSD